jgi:sortase A
VAIALLPGGGVDRRTPLERTLAASSVADAHPPTVETVQALATELGDIAGEGYDQPIDPDRVASVVTVPGDYEVLGRLEIPTIAVDTEIGNGVDPVTLGLGPGHWTGTPAPGRPGNAVISGHRTTHTAPFRDLDQLSAGDAIRVLTQSGGTTTYLVTEVVVVPVEDYTAEVLAQPDDPADRELTLFACHPEGSLTHRIVVHAQTADAAGS